jgi:prophage tail gpP-like protein
VTRPSFLVLKPGWLGPAQPKKSKNRKNRKNKKQKKSRKNKKYVCMNKNNVNLLVYSLTPESGIKIPV